MTTLSERLEACYTGIVHDVMRGMGLKDFVLSSDLRPLIPGKRMAGPAFTISGFPVHGADPHETLVAWTGLLSKAPEGTIWISQPNDRQVAHMGELSAETLKSKGLRGCVIDGFIRDTDFLIEIGFQAWSRGHTPRDIVAYWLPRETNVAITVGGVVVKPEDFLLGDRDGLIRVPRTVLEEVLEKAETMMATENLVRKAILEGGDPQEAYLRYGKF